MLGILVNNNNRASDVNRANAQYNISIGSQITGTEVTTIINKAMDQNERNKIPKDENGLYIENGTNSIKIQLKMVTVDNIYNMEAIYTSGMTNFVANFNTVNFKCIDIQYHKHTGLISKIVFEEQK